jgi:hypothetical protein
VGCYKVLIQASSHKGASTLVLERVRSLGSDNGCRGITGLGKGSMHAKLREFSKELELPNTTFSFKRSLSLLCTLFSSRSAVSTRTRPLFVLLHLVSAQHFHLLALMMRHKLAPVLEDLYSLHAD